MDHRSALLDIRCHAIAATMGLASSSTATPKQPRKVDPWQATFATLQEDVIAALVSKFVEVNLFCPASVVASYTLECSKMVKETYPP